MHACMYVYICGVYICVYTCVCMHLCCRCIHACVLHGFVCMCVHIVCMHRCMCVCVCAHPRVVYICAYMRMCSCVCDFQTQDFLPFESTMSNTKKRVNIFFSLESYIHLIHANIQHTQRNPFNTKWLQILKLLLNTNLLSTWKTKIACTADI